MGNKGAFLRVGLLIVVGTVAILGLILFLSGDRFKRGQVFETYFIESIQGLEVGAPVKYRGVSLGRVTATGLVSAEYAASMRPEMNEESFRLVFVRFSIEADRVGRMPDTESAARSGLRARVASQGITGLSYIELDFVEPGKFPEVPPRPLPWTPTAAYIPSVPSTLAQVQDAAQQLLAKLNKIDAEKLVNSVTALTDDIRTSLNTGDIHQTLRGVDGLIGAARKVVEETDVAGLVAATRRVMDTDVPGVMGDVRSTSAALRQTVQGQEVQSMLRNISTAAEKLAVAVGRLQPVIAALESTSRRVGDGTADLQQAMVPLLRDVRAVVGNLREATEGLRQYPAGTLLGGPPPRNSPAATERAR